MNDMKINAEGLKYKLPKIRTSNRDKRRLHILNYPTSWEEKLAMKELNATEEPQAIINDDKTLIVEGVGKVTSVGELDMKRFIEVALSLPSFWKKGTIV
jgi:hypothetical protein